VRFVPSEVGRINDVLGALAVTVDSRYNGVESCDVLMMC
jgi:hypothetical protein